MLCNPHIQTAPAPSCIDTLIVGTIANISADLTAYINDTTIDRLLILNAVSNSGGIVTIDTSNNCLPINHAIIITLSLRNDTTGEKLTITIAGESSKEVYTRFNDWWDADGVLHSATTYTLALMA